MKVLAYISVAIGTVALGLGIYLHFIVAEHAAIAESNDSTMSMLIGDSYYGSPEQNANFDVMSRKTDTGIVVLFAGALAMILAFVPALRKHKSAWVGIVFGLAALLIGAAYGTHMFS